MRGRVLVVAGSDASGGAGVQADIKAITALGGYAATAITALTAQDTTRVHSVRGVDADFVREQMQVVLDDIGADAIKTGMLFSAETVLTVARLVREGASDVPLVVDPVLWATSGSALYEPDATAAYLEHLIPLATLVTPNALEAAHLTGMPVSSVGEQERAGRALCERGAAAALIKGGHVGGDPIVDVLVTRGGDPTHISAPRQTTRSTHGTGCTLASAIATGLARGLELAEALRTAHAYVQRAIATAPGFGKGHGPLNHGWPLTGGESRPQTAPSRS